jgi:hypothetical protein
MSLFGIHFAMTWNENDEAKEVYWALTLIMLNPRHFWNV